MATQMQTQTKDAIVVTDQRASHSESERIAKEMGGQLLTVKEFIQALKDPVQYQKMRGDWYWTADMGLNLSGYSKIDYENGTITSVSAKEYRKLDVSQRAYAWSGNGPVALYVDFNGYFYSRRLGVAADYGPYLAARVVLKRTGPEGAEKIGKTALEHVEAELGKLESTQKDKAAKAQTLRKEAEQLETESKALEGEIAKRRKAAELLRA